MINPIINLLPLKLAIAGCGGRMGLTLIQSALADARVSLVAGSELVGYDDISLTSKLESVGCRNLPLTSDSYKLVEHADAVIDFTIPEASLTVAKAVAARGGIHVVGATGWTSAQQQKLTSYASEAVIVQSGNFSLGVNLLEHLVEQAAHQLDEAYDIEIVEMHHKHKKDAPSGTALMLGRAAATGRGVDLEEKKVSTRSGITGERRAGDIGFSVLRGGDVVGIHHVLFAGPGEVIEFKHQGFNRTIFASGAIHAALWAIKQKPGLYSMKDVLGY